MNKRKFYLKQQWTVIAALIALSALLCGCQAIGDWVFGDSFPIRDGFSDDLREVLQTKYGVTIPDDAVFVKGLNTNAWLDPGVVVLFTCPMPAGGEGELAAFPYLERHLGLTDAWSESARTDGAFSNEGWLEGMGGRMPNRIDYQDGFSHIAWKAEGETILIRFFGFRPGRSF